MQDGNIAGTGNISQDSFEIDLSVLNADQVGGQANAGSIEGKSDQPLSIEIDQKYQGLPEAEAIARTIQSKYDKLNMDYLAEVKRSQENLTYKEILNDLYTDEDALLAFISERKPELIQSRSVDAEIKKRIVAEFGEGYEPKLSRDEAERKDPGGVDFRYYKKLDSLWNELSQNGSGYSKHKTLKEFRESQIQSLKAKEAEVEAEIQEAITKFGMQKPEVEWTQKWAANLKFSEIVSIARFIRKFKNAPSMGNIPGGESVTMSNNRAEFLNRLKPKG